MPTPANRPPEQPSGRSPRKPLIPTVWQARIVVALLLAFFIYVFARARTPHHPSEASGSYDDATYQIAAEQLVRMKLRDPASATFSSVRVKPGGAGSSAIVCGVVNSRNGFGGMAGGQRFVVGGTVAIEEETGAAGMAELWARFC